MEKYFLGIDRGQTNVKAGICNMNAEVVAVEACPCDPLDSPESGWAQQDMDRIWKQTKIAIKKLLDNNNIPPNNIVAVSFSGQGGGNFLVSEEGRPVYPGVVSMDSRHKSIEDKYDNPKKIEVPRTIGFMRWLKENEPTAYNNTRWILGSKDWIRYCMTGKANADMSDTPALVDFDKREYDYEACDVAGVPEIKSMLPPLVYASEVCGNITEKASKETGLIAGTPVVAGAHDMIACSVGAGGVKQGHLAIILGTLGINICVVDKDTNLKPLEIPGKSFVFGGAYEGTKTATTSIGSGCNTMNWFLDILFKEEVEKAKKQNISVFELLEENLLNRNPSPVIFEPYILGTFYDNTAKAGIWGIDASTTREDIILSLFQGICISMCLEIETLENRVQKFDDIWIVGGGSKSKIWGQMFADVLQRPVYIPSTSEVGCRGAAICAGIALGYYSKDTIPKMETVKTYEPNIENKKIYEKQYEIYKKAFEKFSELWKLQNKLINS